MLQVKVGKSQRAALAVDVEEGAVRITKRGSGSPEEIIPQDKSKGMLPPSSLHEAFAGLGLAPWDGLHTELCPMPCAVGQEVPLYPSCPTFSPAADQVPERAEQGEAGVQS